MEVMSNELIKPSAPLCAGHSDSSNSLTGSGTPLKSVNTPGSSARPRNSQVLPTASCIVPSNENIAQKGKLQSKTPEEFLKDLQLFHEKRGTPITHFPKISGQIFDLHKLYNEVTERGGFLKVNNRDEWDDILPEIGFRDKCVNASAAIKRIYRRFLEKYERLNFFGEDPDKVDAADVSDSNDGGRLRRFFTSTLSGNGVGVNIVPMTYNYRQHIVNMDRRRMYKMSLDLHKPSPYEKLMLSLISPLPNEQDFGINVCTLMANESKHTLKLNEFPKLLDVLLAHAGIFSDSSLRELFQYVYKEVRRHSLLGFWTDLLYKKPQILELCSIEQAAPAGQDSLSNNNIEFELPKWPKSPVEECLDMDFLNLGRGMGTQDYVGQRVQQIVSILRNLSFFDENLHVFAKNRNFMRFVIMCANIRWGNVHNQALDIAGNVATELDLLDPTSDELSRSLMATLCDGVEGMDRAVIINSLEIMYKLCQRDGNEDHIFKCLNLKFYQTICLFLSLNDIMLLIYTLETIYALSSLGARFCHLIMQVRGVVDQLVSLITVEAQSYGPDGCILMRVVETVPGNMLPMVAQNIANLQNVAAIQSKHTNIAPQHANAEQNMQQPHQMTTVDVPQLNVCPQQTNAAAAGSTGASHDDEQYALAWLGATFDRAASVDSRVEQQELYRMYLSHCQKSGKHSVVTHTQFPRLVRLIFTNNVGPISVKQSDGSELPGLYYVSIRLRAQPLPIQGKITQTPQKCLDVGSPVRKLKKKPKLLPEQQQQAQQLNPVPIAVNPVLKQEAIVESPSSSSTIAKTNPLQAQELGSSTNVSAIPAVPLDTPKPAANITANPVSVGALCAPQNTDKALTPAEEASLPCSSYLGPTSTESLSATATHSTTSATQSLSGLSTHQQPSSSLIKSLLANKVTQRQQKQKEMVVSTVVAAQPSPLKVASTSISALVNNPLMQNTPLKVGQTTIKPLNTQTTNEKKHHPVESTPPPLAPLSGGGTANMSSDSSGGRPVIISNQKIVDRLDKKHTEPAMPSTSNPAKRKADESAVAIGGREPAKRLAIEAVKLTETQVTPSKNAANLYAEMAASILEDEDLEDIPPAATATAASVIKTKESQHQSVIIPATIQATGVPLQNVQRQLLFQSNPGPHLKLTSQSQQIPTAMATIKTDQGLQTVPVILQSKSLDQQQPQLIQQVLQQQQTQYVLATNPQGQTYLVAQQTPVPAPVPPPQPTQTVLVTQTPQQQSAGTKTIIILQQQTLGSQSSQPQIIASGHHGSGQKMLMTTAQGQQVLVTQRQPPTMTNPSQQQIFINPQLGTATQFQHVPVSSVTTNIQQTNPNMLQRQLMPPTVSVCNNPTPQAGQISPSLLSQLNHIPATIKLHNPNVHIGAPTVQTHCQAPNQLTPAALARLGKSLSIVQTAPALTTATPLQIPQLQQHQSIIQQHIISGPSEKRQVIVGGRAIDIKETVITQTHQPALQQQQQQQQQQPPQQSQLNAQTIITTQPTTLQPQKMVAVTQQQQPPSSSIIQQKINQAAASAAIHSHQQTVSKATDAIPSLFQSCVKFVPQPQQVTQMPTQSPAQAAVSTMKKQLLPQHCKASPPQGAGGPSTMATQSVFSTAGKPFINSRPTTPVSVSTTETVSTAPGTAPTTVATTSAITTTAPLVPISISGGGVAAAQSQQDTSKYEIESKETKPIDVPVHTTQSKPIGSTFPVSAVTTSTAIPTATSQLQATVQPVIDPNWLYICDWRNCPRRKFRSVQDLHHHACLAHCPDHLEAGAEIFCQWGPGPGLCDGIPRKRFSLMTHILDRHLTVDSLRNAVQRRIQSGVASAPQPLQSPVTIVRNLEASQRGSTASPALSTSSSGSLPSTGSSAIHAIKRHTADFVNPKELMDENEGPVTKSIRLTAALVLRNLVTFTANAKRSLRRHEAHLANVALSNVESSATISHILFELNN